MGAFVGAQALKVPQIQFFDDKVAGQFQFLDKVMVGPVLCNDRCRCFRRWLQYIDKLLMCSCDAVAGSLHGALLRNARLDSEYTFCSACVRNNNNDHDNDTDTDKNNNNRHLWWVQCSHGLTSRPLESCHHQCLQFVGSSVTHLVQLRSFWTTTDLPDEG